MIVPIIFFNFLDNALASGVHDPETNDEALGIKDASSLLHLKTASTEPDQEDPNPLQLDNSDHISFIDGEKMLNHSQENVIQVKDNTEQKLHQDVEKPGQEIEEEKEGESKVDFLIVPNEDPNVIFVPQEIADRIMNLELAIQERNIQMSEFQDIISSLKERNAALEKEKEDEMNKHAGFRQETLEEAQHLRDIYVRLQEKEKHLDDLIDQNTPQSSTPSKESSNNDSVDWFQECIKASKRLQDLEECMLRQDGLFQEIEAERETLKAEVNKLKAFISEHEKPEPVTFEGVQELLKDIQRVANKLHKENNPAPKSPKAIRFYPDKELAVKELQSMKKAKTTAVFIVANAFSTTKDLLYKKIGKKKGRKQRRELRIQNLVNSTGNNRSIDHIKEEGSATSLQERQDDMKRTDECIVMAEPQNVTEMVVSVDAPKCEDAVTVEATQNVGATEDENATTVEASSDIFDLTNVVPQDFTESPRLSQSIKELKTAEVDSLRNVLQKGRAVNTLALKSSSVLLCYRQQLSPVCENEENRVIPQESQSEEVGELIEPDQQN